MRIVIDKDISEIQLLNEAYKKSKPTYKVMAVENGEKFVYGKELSFNEARDSILDLAFDPMFGNIDAELVEVVSESDQRTIWSSDSKTIVKESTMFEADNNNGGGEQKKGLWDKIKGAAKGALDKLKGAWNVTKQITGQFSKDMLNKWRNAHYFTKDGQITGLGYKVMTGQAKNTVPAETDDKTGDITKVWEVVKSNVTTALKKQGFTINGEIEAFVKNDKDPIQLTASVTDKDGNEQKLMMTQDGGISNGTGGNAENTDGSQNNNGGDNGGGDNGEGNNNGGGDNGGNNGGGDNGGGDAGGNANTQQITPDQAQKNPKAALGNLATRVANLEKEVGIAAESKWNYNNEEKFAKKDGFERRTIKRFFNEMNDESVKNIKFERADGTFKIYDISNGSQAYSEFRKDFRESTEKIEKSGVFKECRVVVESLGSRSRLNGFKFSDFGMADDWDSDSKTIVIRESVIKEEAPVDPDDKKKVSESTVQESSIDGLAKDPEPNGFTLELDKKDPLEEMKSLLGALNKYNGVEPKKVDDIQDGSISDGVTTYPDVPTFETPKKQEPLETPKQETPKVEVPEVVKEADGDDEGGGDDAGGGDADPFAGGGDTGGGDAGGDAGGGDADPFAGGGGDDAGGGDAGGGDADPFAGGDDAGGGDAGGVDAGGDAGGDMGGDAGADAGAPEDPAAGEPAPEDPVNTDAEGNPKSQYNINVTRPFNTDDDFSLNEEEQKEFFGKIDQLVKIPDMDNYSLYLYQITPENMNLDDVHYIQALYDLSVKLGLLEDVYADSNLLEKYSSYKYSVLKDGEPDATEGDDALTVQESGKMLFESKVDADNKEKAKQLKDASSKEKQTDDDRRGAKDTKLDLDKNGAPKPVIIDTTKEGWDSTNGKEHKKAIDSTTEGEFHGLGWIATFKAMQFGSPRYLSLYIKKNGKGKAEDQCREYLEKLSYSNIEFVNIDEVDPYEYVYRSSASGMKTPETVRTEKYANEGVPVTYLENSDTKVPESIPGDIKRDIKRVITKLNAEIRGTKQFNFLKECGVEKPQLDHFEFLTHYKTALVNETLSETTYKFVLKKNDSQMSRMFFSNMKEKLFKYLGTFATKYNMECGCEATPTAVTISFMRSDLGNPGYDLETMVDADVALPETTDQI